MKMDPQYHERKFTYIPYLMLVTIFLCYLWSFNSGNYSIWTPVLFFLMIFFAFNFQELVIDVNDNYLTFGFGLIKRKIPITEIKKCSATKIKFSNYLGLGIMKGRDGTVAYATSYGKGIKVVTTKSTYVVSTHNPEILCRIITETR